MTKTHIGLHVKYLLYLSDLLKLDSFFFRQGFEKFSNIKFHENLSNESRVVPCVRTGRNTDSNDEFKGRFSQFFESS